MAVDRECWRAGDLLIDVGRQRVERAGVEVVLPPLSFRLLLELVRAAPNVLSIDRLMDAVWPGLVVSPDTVTQRVKLLREVLGDTAQEPRYVKGLRGRGYVLAIDAARVVPETVGSIAAAESVPVGAGWPPGHARETETAADTAPRSSRERAWLPWAAAVALVAAAAWLVGGLAGFGDRGAPVRLAVLPFVSTSDDAADAYLADGMADELIGALAKVAGLRVVVVGAPNLVAADATPTDVGRRVNATHLLQGSVRAFDGSLRVSAQLVRVADGAVLWAETYSRGLDALLPLRDELAVAVLRELRLTLPTTARAAIPSEAHRLFLRAEFLTQRTSAQGFAEALSLYDAALALAPTYAAAWEGKARLYQFQAGLKLVDPEEGFARARDMATKALAADPTFALAHTRLGALDLLQGDLASAARHIQRGYELEPTNSLTIGNAANLLRSLGRLEESIAIGSVADDMSPLNPRGMLAGGVTRLAAGRNAEAAEHFRTTLSLSPGFQSAGYYLGLALFRMGDFAGARAAIDGESAASYRLRGLVLLEHALGQDVAADAALTDLGQRFAAGEGSAYGLAVAHAARGRLDEAFAWLERAALVKYEEELALLVVEPMFQTLHGDPRWSEFVVKLGRSPADLAAIPFDAVGR